jgi:hypothetical protein
LNSTEDAYTVIFESTITPGATSFALTDSPPCCTVDNRDEVLLTGMTLEEMSQVILSITADPKLTSFVRQKQQQKTTAKRERGRGGGRRGGGREGGRGRTGTGTGSVQSMRVYLRYEHFPDTLDEKTRQTKIRILLPTLTVETEFSNLVMPVSKAAHKAFKKHGLHRSTS